MTRDPGRPHECELTTHASVPRDLASFLLFKPRCPAAASALFDAEPIPFDALFEPPSPPYTPLCPT